MGVLLHLLGQEDYSKRMNRSVRCRRGCLQNLLLFRQLCSHNNPFSRVSSCLYSTLEEVITFKTKGPPRRRHAFSITRMLQFSAFFVTVYLIYASFMPCFAQKRTIFSRESVLLLSQQKNAKF